MKATLLPILFYVVLPLAACALVVLRQLYLRRRRVARLRGPAPADVTAELRAELREVLRAVPPRPALLSTASSSALSLAIEARLLSGLPQRALEEAEHELLQSHSASTFVAIAKALLYCNLEDEARAALRWAQRLGANDPEYDYLRARLRPTDREALRLCLRACRRDPGYAEALYLCARLALVLGFHSEGERLLRGIAPLMTRSVEREAYRRDLEALAGPALPGATRSLLARLHSPRAPARLPTADRRAAPVL